MSHVAVGKLLPNLKVTIGNDDTSLEKSGECKSDELILNAEDDHDIEIVRTWMTSLPNPKVYKNKNGAFTTGLDLISEKNAERLDKRAERFGIEKEESSISENILSLYESMGVDMENKASAKMKNMRLDALHLRGINELNTNEVFQYFQDYGPASVEWINDFSCNVVWLDETTCARALLGNSKPLQRTKKKTSILTDSDESKETVSPAVITEAIPSKEEEEMMETEDGDRPFLEIPVPPGPWRLGIQHPKAKSILLRFATKDDKKLPGAEKRSTFYQKYGNPNYGGLTGLISGSRKRKILAATNRRVIESSQSQSPEEEDYLSEESVVSRKSRVPRMRMYADDEELKTKKSQFHDQDDEIKRPSVHSRLGAKYTQEDLCQLRVDPSDRLTDILDRKRQNHQVDLRRKIKKIQTESDERKHRSPLCVED